MVILVAKAERSTAEGINEKMCADRTIEIVALEAAQVWPESPLNVTA